MRRLTRITALAMAVPLSAVGAAFGQGGMENLGTFGGSRSVGLATNFDGSIVVGTSSYSFIGNNAFRWTAATGMVDIGTLGGTSAQATDISDDGGTIVGSAGIPGGASRAFIWTSAGGMLDLGTLGGTHSIAYGVNADGTVIVGSATLPNNDSRAFRWTAATGMQDLGTLPLYSRRVEARAVNADGSVVVGFAENGSGQERAFRWTAATGMVHIGNLGQNDSRALDVDASGDVVVGYSRVTTAVHAFRWTPAAGMVDLGTLAGTLTSASSAQSVSADGNTIAGSSQTSAGPNRAFRWTGGGGMIDLGTLPGYTSRSHAFGISGDGDVVVGHSLNSLFVERTFRWGVGVEGAIGQSYCMSTANSTGAMGDTSVLGSNSVSANFVRLIAESLPPFSFGFFLTSQTQGSTFPVANSDGRLCVGGSIGRFVGPGQIRQSNASGFFDLAIDLTALPGPNGPMAVATGQTWNFQAWYRDANPSATSNFTDGESVLFP